MKRNSLIALIGGVVVVILLWYFMLFSPTSSDLNDTRDQVAAMRSQNQELQNTIRRLKELSRNAPQQQATLRTLRAAIPANPDLGEFILQANDIAAAAGIDWLSISPSPPTATSGGGPKSTIAVTLQVNGGFFEVLDYLNRLEDLERLVLVDTVNVSTGGTTGTGSTATGGAAAASTSGGAPDLSVTVVGRMFTGAEAPSSTGGSTSGGGSTTPTRPTTPTTSSASSTGTGA